MAKLNSTEKKLLKEVEDWRDSGPGFLTRAANFATKPLVWAADKVIPQGAKDAMGNVTDKIVDKLQDVSQWTVSEKDVLDATREFEINSETILELKNASVFDLIHFSEEFTKTNARIAAAEGFGTGLLGWPGLIADLPALFTLAFRLIYQTSLSFGYAIDKVPEGSNAESFEMGYMLRIFQAAASSNGERKDAALMELKNYEDHNPNFIKRDGLIEAPHSGGDYLREQIGKTVGVNLSRILINEIIKETFSRKAITSIPGIGAVLTAGFNYYYMQDVGNAASFIYRERFLLDKQGRPRIISVPID